MSEKYRVQVLNHVAAYRSSTPPTPAPTRDLELVLAGLLLAARNLDGALRFVAGLDVAGPRAGGPDRGGKEGVRGV